MPDPLNDLTPMERQAIDIARSLHFTLQMLDRLDRVHDYLEAELDRIQAELERDR